MSKSVRLSFLVMSLLASSAIGYVMGWLTGSSQSAVVATVLPLVFGLLGGISVGAVGKLVKSIPIISTLKKSNVYRELEEDAQQQIEKIITEDAATSQWSPVMASTGVLLFAISFYVGLQRGIDVRIPEYRPLSQSFKDIPLRSYEISSLYQLRFAMQKANVSADEYNSVIEGVFKPIFKRYPIVDNRFGAEPKEMPLPPAPPRESADDTPSLEGLQRQIDTLRDRIFKRGVYSHWNPVRERKAIEKPWLEGPGTYKTDQRYHEFFEALHLLYQEKAPDGAELEIPQGPPPVPNA